MIFTVALLQLNVPGNDPDVTLVRGEAACRRAKAGGADLALFPEMWSAGYTPRIRMDESIELWRGKDQWKSRPLDEVDLPAVWKDLAISQANPYFLHFRNLASELEMAIALTYLEQWEPAPRNTVSIIDRWGNVILTYAKVHTCDWSPDEAALTPGDDFHVATLNTAAGGVEVGAMICYDREFPESARILMLKGAEIILTPNACDLEINRLAQFRTRAVENMVGVAMANYAGNHWGQSVAYDPVAYVDGQSRDTVLVEADESEGIFYARFDLDRIRDYRARETWGNAFRRPHCYGPLVSPEIRDPFVRVCADGTHYDPARRLTSFSKKTD